LDTVSVPSTMSTKHSPSASLVNMMSAWAAVPSCCGQNCSLLIV